VARWSDTTVSFPFYLTLSNSSLMVDATPDCFLLQGSLRFRLCWDSTHPFLVCFLFFFFFFCFFFSCFFSFFLFFFLFFFFFVGGFFFFFFFLFLGKAQLSIGCRRFSSETRVSFPRTDTTPKIVFPFVKCQVSLPDPR